MAAFFHGGSEIQDSSSSDLTLQQQNLFLMNPNSLPYPTTRFFNPNTATAAPIGHALIHAPQSDQLLVGIPTSMDMATNGHGHHQYQNLCFGSPVDPNPTHNINHGMGGSQGFEFLPREPPAPVQAPVVSPGNYKRLSLTLSSQQQQPPAEVPSMTSNDAEQGNSPVSTVTNGVVLGVTQGGGSVGVFDPKYLKAARELLDEIVSVGDPENVNNVNGSKEKLKMKKESAGGGFCGGGGDLSSAHKQELQMKKAKLVSMVEEVEQRYKQYRHQMQTIVSSFEYAAGLGSARPYTSVALQTISKQFRSLKDSITSQITTINKTFGEDDCVGAKGESSRLRFVDHHHQLRHLGMIQHHHNNAWRPQRGLPERAVSVLRAWLFEHFLHPYPRDSDKQMLAKQTGLTRSQVSNWFINARVRLWKPMVEEMYTEEMKDQPETKSHNLDEASSPKQPFSNNAPQEHNNSNNIASDQCSSSNIVTSQGTIVSPQIKKPRTMTVQNDVVPFHNSSCSVVSFDVAGTKRYNDHMAMTRANFNGGFGNYNAALGNCVSLSLGLPPSCDHRIGSIQFGTSNQIEFSGVSPSSTYQDADMSDKKRFSTAAAPLLPDFFA